jgi:hypothetical protein
LPRARTRVTGTVGYCILKVWMFFFLFQVNINPAAV